MQRDPCAASHGIHHEPASIGVPATNVELERVVAEHRFRQDLYYRLGVIIMRLPPLRERRGDVALLVEQFLRASSQRRGRSVSITPPAVTGAVWD